MPTEQEILESFDPATRRVLIKLKERSPERYQERLDAKRASLSPAAPAPAPQAPPTPAAPPSAPETPSIVSVPEVATTPVDVAVAPTEADVASPSLTSGPSASVGGPSGAEREENLREAAEAAVEYATKAPKADVGFLGAGASESGKFQDQWLIDVDKKRRNLRRAKIEAWRKDYAEKNDGKMAPLEEQKKAIAGIDADVEKEIEQWSNRLRGQGMGTMDIDPRGDLAKIRESAAESFLGRATAPLEAMWRGASIDFAEGVTAPGEELPEHITYNEGWSNAGWTEWGEGTLRQSLGTLVSTALVASGNEDLSTEVYGATPLAAITLGGKLGAAALGVGDRRSAILEWGSDEHISLLAKGHDQFSSMDMGLNLGIPRDGATDQFLSTVPAAMGLDLRASDIINFGYNLALALADVDLFTLAGAATGGTSYLAGKAGKLAAPVAKAMKLGDTAVEVLDPDLARVYRASSAENTLNSAIAAAQEAKEAGGTSDDMIRAANDALYAAVEAEEISPAKANAIFGSVVSRMDAELMQSKAPEALVRDATTRTKADLDRLDDLYGMARSEEVIADETYRSRASLDLVKKSYNNARKAVKENEQVLAAHEALEEAAVKVREGRPRMRKDYARKQALATLPEAQAKLVALRSADEATAALSRATAETNRLRGHIKTVEGALSKRAITPRNQLTLREMASNHVTHIKYLALAEELQKGIDSIEAVRRGMSSASRGSKGLFTDPAAAQRAADAVETKTADIVKLRNDLLDMRSDATGDVGEAVVAKQQELSKAWDEWQDAVQEAAKYGLEKRLNSLRAARKQLLQDADVIASEQGRLLKVAKKSKNLRKTADQVARRQRKEVARVKNLINAPANKRMSRNRALTEKRFMQAMTELRDQFGRIATGKSSLEDAQAITLERMFLENRAVFEGGLLATAKDKAGSIYNTLIEPWRNRHNFTHNKDVSDMLNDMRGMHARATEELIGVIQMMGEGNAGRAMETYLTTTEPLPLPGGKVSLYNITGREGVIDGVMRTLSPWEEAQDVLLAQFAQLDAAAKGTSKDMAVLDRAPKFVSALAMMFVGPRDVVTARQNVGRLIKSASYALRESKGDINKFVQLHQASTTAVLGTAGVSARGLESAGGIGAWDILTKAVIGASVMDRSAQQVTEYTMRQIGNSRGMDMDAVGKALSNMATNPADVGPGFADALKIFEIMGMRPDILRHYDALAETTKTGIEAISNGRGYNVFIPRQIMKAIEDAAGNIVKSTDYFVQQDAALDLIAVRRWLRSASRLISSHLVYGLFAPKGQAFTNISVGNTYQAWAYEGAGTALGAQARALSPTPAVSARLGKYLPASMDFLPGNIGRGLDVRRAEMAVSLGKPISEVRPSPFVAENPFVSEIMDPHLLPNEAIVRQADRVAGTPAITAGQLRKIIVEQGVASTFITKSSLRQAIMQKQGVKGSTWDRVAKAFDILNIPRKTWIEMADTFEQRQRVALFLELFVNKGMEPALAAKKTKASYYDWNSPMSYVEDEYISQYFMFWAYHRRSFDQAGQVLASQLGFGNYAGEGAFRANTLLATATGGTPAAQARIRDAMQLERAMKAWLRSDDSEEDSKEDRLSRIYPGWAEGKGSKTFLSQERLSEKFAKEYKEYTGNEVTHIAYAAPGHPVLEKLVTLGTLLGAVAAAPFGNERGPGVGESLADTIIEFGGPLSKPMMQAWAYEVGLARRPKYYGEHDWQVRKAGDKQVITAVNGVWRRIAGTDLSGVNIDDKTGIVRLTPSAKRAYHLAAPITKDLATYLEYYQQQKMMDQGTARSILFTLNQFFGTYRGYLNNPEVSLEFDERELGNLIDEEIRRTKGR